MPYLLNAIYLCALAVLSPWLLYKSLTTGKYRHGLLAKALGRAMLRHADGPCAWFHGVSVGETHLLRRVVAAFRLRHPDWDCVISTTTETGFTEACRCFPDLPVFYWPFDFSWAVHRALRQVNPTMVVLAESELWPNFLITAADRGVLVAVINGRMSPQSLARYRHLGFLVRSVLKRIGLLAAQTEEYAAAFRSLGAPAAHVRVTGSVKYDGVATDRINPETEQLRSLLGVGTSDQVWVAGSTQAPEEEIILGIYGRLRPRYPGLRLYLVPRQKDRFDDVAALLKHAGIPFLRRSTLTGPVRTPHSVVLVDSIGELSALWGLADLAFVGGSLDGRRGGQNMIEPAAYGAAVLFGPHVWNFRDTADRLVEAGAAIQVIDAAGLEEAVGRLLNNPGERRMLGEAAQRLVCSQQGATARTIDLLDGLMREAHHHLQAA